MHRCTQKHSHQALNRQCLQLITFTFLHFCLRKLYFRQQQAIDFSGACAFVCLSSERPPLALLPVSNWINFIRTPKATQPSAGTTGRKSVQINALVPPRWTQSRGEPRTVLTQGKGRSRKWSRLASARGKRQVFTKLHFESHPNRKQSAVRLDLSPLKKELDVFRQYETLQSELMF